MADLSITFIGNICNRRHTNQKNGNVPKFFVAFSFDYFVHCAKSDFVLFILFFFISTLFVSEKNPLFDNFRSFILSDFRDFRQFDFAHLFRFRASDFSRCKRIFYAYRKPFLIAAIHGGIALVIRGFITWYDEIKLKEELVNKSFEMELALIKSQINPHFLFNTINNIDVLISKDAGKASEYLNKLSDILRYMVYETKTEKIFLAKELNYIGKISRIAKNSYDKFGLCRFSNNRQRQQFNNRADNSFSVHRKCLQTYRKQEKFQLNQYQSFDRKNQTRF